MQTKHILAFAPPAWHMAPALETTRPRTRFSAPPASMTFSGIWGLEEGAGSPTCPFGRYQCGAYLRPFWRMGRDRGLFAGAATFCQVSGLVLRQRPLAAMGSMDRTLIMAEGSHCSMTLDRSWSIRHLTGAAITRCLTIVRPNRCQPLGVPGASSPPRRRPFHSAAKFRLVWIDMAVPGRLAAPYGARAVRSN
jgi:hypothetical protein